MDDVLLPILAAQLVRKTTKALALPGEVGIDLHDMFEGIATEVKVR
jgi:hypothetical protein